LFASDNKPIATIVLERGRLVEAITDTEFNKRDISKYKVQLFLMQINIGMLFVVF